MDVDLTQYTAYKSSPIETKDGRILEFLGVHNNTLWLTTTNHNLFGIDVNTGEILHHFRDSPELKKGDFMFDYIGFGSRHATKLIEKESIIIGLTLSMSWQLDLTTKNWTFVDIRSQLGDRGHMTNVLSIDIDSAWFTSEPVIRDLHVGHLDRKTHKITTWRCKELHPDMRLVFTIIQKDNMVYMHDQGKRLFAFQLEEGELGQSL